MRELKTPSKAFVVQKVINSTQQNKLPTLFSNILDREVIVSTLLDQNPNLNPVQTENSNRMLSTRVSNSFSTTKNIFAIAIPHTISDSDNTKHSVSKTVFSLQNTTLPCTSLLVKRDGDAKCPNSLLQSTNSSQNLKISPRINNSLAL